MVFLLSGISIVKSALKPSLNAIFAVRIVVFRFKYEEDVEEGGDRWSKPHVATLSLYSLFEVRNCLMSGTVILDLEANSLAQIAGI